MTEPVQPLIYEEKPPAYSTVRDYLSVVLRHKRKAVIFFVITLVAVLVCMSILQDAYRSEAKLLVRPGWESMNVDPTAATSETAGSLNQSQTVLLNTMLDIIQSEALAETVVDRLGPGAFLLEPGETASPGKGNGSKGGFGQGVKNFAKKLLGIPVSRPMTDRENAVKCVMENTDARVLHHTQIISIAFTSPNPELSQNVVRELTDLCLEKHKLVYRNPDSYKFLEEHEKETRTEMNRLRREMTTLKKEMGLTSVRDRLDFIENNIGSLEQAIDQAEAERVAAEAKIGDLKGKLEEIPKTQRTGETTSTDYSVINSLRDQLYQLQNERQSLLSRFTEDSEVVREKDRQIKAVENLLASEKPREVKTETWALNTAYQEVESALRLEETTLTSLVSKVNELENQHGKLENERKELLVFDYRYSQLEAELRNREAQYEKITAKVAQARMEQALEEKRISNMSEIQPATCPLEPEKSRKLMILVAGFFAGILGGILLTFLADYLDHTLKTPEQVESRLEIPALVSIPRANGKTFSMKLKK
ncbi:MAG: GumC family protein [Planctomycetota bacterium]|jgi:uncharacterized protein involved in exopolysaccharide biosynthesis